MEHIKRKTLNIADHNQFHYKFPNIRREVVYLFQETGGLISED